MKPLNIKVSWANQPGNEASKAVAKVSAAQVKGVQNVSKDRGASGFDETRAFARVAKAS